MTDGVMTMREIYGDMRANVKLADEVFDTSEWREAAWVKK